MFTENIQDSCHEAKPSAFDFERRNIAVIAA